MTAPILVTGGTGTLGSLVVPRLLDKGSKVRVLTRRPRESRDGVEYVGGDLRQGDVSAAVDGAETVLHLAGDAKHDEQTTTAVVRAAQRSGVRHLVFISVIGADRVPLGYFRNKYAAEQVVANGGVPWTTLRAAQFHDLVFAFARGVAKSPIVPLPGMRWQPVEASEVADRLAELALGDPAGAVPDLAGPEVNEVKDMIRGYLRATGKHRLTLPVRMPGKAGRAYRNDENLNLGADRGTRTWAEYLAEKIRSGQR
jgi:uncharacterized protein YbjT (DUF2867 family)